MLNRRPFLLGLGIGIMIGAILLQLFYLGQNSQENLKEIGRQLESPDNGQQDGAAPPEQSGSPEAEQQLQPTPDSAAEPAESEQAPAASPTAAHTTNPVEEDAANPSAQTGEAASGALKLIRIEPGMKLAQIAALLTENRIISAGDAGAFVRGMQAGNLKARAGYFAMSEGAGVDAVITAVTSKPLSKEEAEKRVSEQQQ
ncbi:hypothetical protein D3P08_15390 [Paenibacillus nanensis]|uniref:Uncharacterized protein n=1 Tax=Paenibacillus nanensis TaxID=393251 RepID=A0A3A1UTI4_9BACL|nr:hypothetical protein [Paenibacillus nanensis]RIX51797.1 hypothetical protein D3P08_15390 [Paenibacillus nanensis]